MAIPDEIQAYLSRLEEKIEFLEAKLEAEKTLRRGTMRDTRRCPSCGGQKILYIKELHTSLAYTKEFVYTAIKDLRSYQLLGVAQAFCCANCGHSELQLLNISGLEEQQEVEVLTQERTSEGPYR